MSMGVWDKDPSEWKAYDLHMYAGDASIPAALYKRLQSSGVYDRAYRPMILAAFRNRPSLIDSVKTDEEHAELEQWALRDAFMRLVNYGYSMLGGGSQSAINRHMAESRLGWLNMGWQTNLYYQAPFANSMWSWQDREFRLHNRSNVKQAAAESIVNAVARINAKDKSRVQGTPSWIIVPDDILDIAQNGSAARPTSELTLAQRIIELLPYDYTGITVGVQTGEVGSMGMDLYDNVRGRVPQRPTVAKLEELMASANRKYPGHLVKMYATAPGGVLDALCLWTAKGGFKVPDYGWEASNLRLGGTRKEVAAWIVGRGPNPAVKHAAAKQVGWVS